MRGDSSSLKILEDSIRHIISSVGRCAVCSVERRTVSHQVTEQLEQKCLIRRHTLLLEILMLLYFTKQ